MDNDCIVTRNMNLRLICFHIYLFSAWRLLKGCTHLNKPAAESVNCFFVSDLLASYLLASVILINKFMHEVWLFLNHAQQNQLPLKSQLERVPNCPLLTRTLLHFSSMVKIKF